MKHARSNLNRVLTQTLAAACALLLPVLAAFGQTTIPDDLVKKSSLGSGDTQMIKAFVDTHKAGLSGTPAEVKKSREALSAPLERPGVSVAFRVALTTELADTLKKNAADKDKDIVAVNSLRLAGDLATTNTIDTLIKGLEDKRESVRYAATHGFARMFTAAEKYSPAITPEEGLRIMRALGDVVEKDTSAQVADGAAIAMIAGRGFTKSVGIQRLAEAGSRKVMAMAKAGGASDLTSILRIAGALRNDFADQNLKLMQEAKLAAAKFAGQTLMLVSRQLGNGGDRASQVQTGKAAHSVLTLAAQSLQQGAEAEIDPRIPSQLDNNKDVEFQKAVELMIKGPLVNAPFNFKPADFQP